MHQILKIDERISFLTIGVKRGEKYLPSKHQQKVKETFFCHRARPRFETINLRLLVETES